MSNNKVPMTKFGHDSLKVELQRLVSEDRPAVIQAIAEARAHGDLKENAEYHAAREQQGLLEARIRDIESKLANANVIDITKIDNSEGKVIFGATVTMIDADSDKTVCYQIVGDDESNIKLGKISVNSPMARAMIGKFEGEFIDVQAPGGIVSYEIDAVEYK